MPLLNLGRQRRDALDPFESSEARMGLPVPGQIVDTNRRPGGKGGLFEACSNPGCRTGWLHLWRSRSTPVVEGGWSCSAECTEALVSAALAREMDGRGVTPEAHRHRIPLGLLMMRQGWISGEQLHKAVDAQKAAGGGRLGYWLVRQQGVNEQLVTRALGLQWGCPVLGMEFHDAEGLTTLVPRLFIDAFGALPLRVAAGKILYLGFEDRLDPVLALALERMTGLRVESGVVQESLFRPAHNRMLAARFPSVELIEAASEPVLAEAIARRLERLKPIDARMVRVHDCIWMRLWQRPQQGPVPQLNAVQDLICSVRPH
jgi:hypothetical protein